MTAAYAHPADGHPIGDRGVPALLNTRVDDKRVQARAYRRWVAMLRGRICPSIEDLEPFGVAGPCDVMMDIRAGSGDPELTCIGGALIADCGRRGMRRLSEVPSESYLALLAAHWRHVAATRQPIAFDGQRPCPGGAAADYRAILLPLSSQGETVDFVYGTLAWREPADAGLAAAIARQVEHAASAAPSPCLSALWPLAGEEPGKPLALTA